MKKLIALVLVIATLWNGQSLSQSATALVWIARERGDFAAALRHARELAALDPENAQLGALISDLEKKAKP